MTDITARNELLIDSEQLEYLLDDDATLIVFVARIPHQCWLCLIQYVSPSELTCGIPPAVGKLQSIDKLTALFRRIGLAKQSTYCL